MIIKIECLHKLYQPQWLFNHYKNIDPWTALPIAFVPDDERKYVVNYDGRRVRHFLNILSNGRMFKPLSVVGYWYDSVDLMDGHHRYMAAVFAGIEQVPIEFHGIEKVLKVLQK